VVLAHLRRLRRVLAPAGGHPAVPPLDLARPSDREPDGGAAMTGTDDALVFRAVRESVLGQFADLADIAVNGDRDAAAEIARRHLPRLVAGMRALLAGHVPDSDGHCVACASRRRRGPRLCRQFTEFQLAIVAYDERPLRPARHRLWRKPKC
jgi:hypothetical protein